MQDPNSQSSYWTTPLLSSSAFPRRAQGGPGAEHKYWTSDVIGQGGEKLGLGVRYEGEGDGMDWSGAEIYPAVETHATPQGASTAGLHLHSYDAPTFYPTSNDYTSFPMDYAPDQLPYESAYELPVSTYPPLEGEIVFVPFIPDSATPATQAALPAHPQPIPQPYHDPLPVIEYPQPQSTYTPVPPPNPPPPLRRRSHTSPSTFPAALPSPPPPPRTIYSARKAPLIPSRLAPLAPPVAEPIFDPPPCANQPGLRPPSPLNFTSMYNPILPPLQISTRRLSRPNSSHSSTSTIPAFASSPFAAATPSFPTSSVPITELRRSLIPTEPFHRHLPLQACRAESPTPMVANEYVQWEAQLAPKVEEEYDIVVKGLPVGELKEEVRRYLVAEDRLAIGQRSVLIFNPRLAQRSFGNEQRFLCPPPMALLLGRSWWTNLPSSPPTSRANIPPEVFFSIATDTPTFPSQLPVPPLFHQTFAPSPQPLEPAPVEWLEPSGRLCGTRKDKERVLCGRAVSTKTLVVRAPEEAEGKAILQARVEVEVVVPGKESREQRLLGKFVGKPLTVLSRPSKQRQGPLSCMSLQHGTLVSLFNRGRSVASKNQYLAVSGHQASFPTMDWRAMTTTARTFAPADSGTTQFVTRTDGWDAFVIYAVDLSLPLNDPDIAGAPPPHPGYPRPPDNAIPFDVRNPKGIYYNMPVVLQCLSTAVVSPILFIRALDHNSHAIGGASLSPPSPIDPSLPCAPNEILGEPVSQFHLTALELFSDYNFKKDPFRPPPPNTFLACCENEVRTVEGKGGRQFVGLEEVVVRGDSSEGRKVIKRRTSVAGFASPYGANSDLRKRGKSVSNLSVAVAKEKERPRAWTIECGEQSLWSMVAVDVTRTTFYIPPSVRGGIYTGGALPPPPSSVPLYSTLLPSFPIQDSPIVFEYELTRPSNGAPPMISILGENFSPSYHVWLGSTPCMTCVFKNSRRFLVGRPPNYALNLSRTPTTLPVGLRITLVRTDGVVFPSNTMYCE